MSIIHMGALKASRKAKMILEIDDDLFYEKTKKKSNKIQLIHINEKEKVFRFISGLELARRVEEFTKARSCSANDIENGYNVPQGEVE